MNQMNFFLPMEPPTATKQEQQSTINKAGKHVTYKPARLVEAEDKLTAALIPHIPPQKFAGPIKLEVIWLFGKNSVHAHGDWKTSKPDTDNLNKLLKDLMTQLGFWTDDAQVVNERISKLWTGTHPGVYISLEELPTNSGLMAEGDDAL